MKLKDTVELMLSEDYVERVQAEFNQLVIRIKGLEKMLEDWENDTLKFEPKSPKKLYKEQLAGMKKYAANLHLRMDMEGIPEVGVHYIDGEYVIDKTTEELAESIKDPISDDIKEYNGLIPNVDIRYHRELFPALEEVVKKGNFVDLRAAEAVYIKAGEFAKINLGVSIKLPEGYWGQFVPRSSTFKNYGIIQTNSFAVIDTEYCGDNDIWTMPVYATRDTVIGANERICQFRIVKDNPFTMTEVEKLEGPDRGGFGSTGKK